MKKHILFMFVTLILLSGCDLFNPSTDTDGNESNPEPPTVVHVTGITVSPTNLSLSISGSQKLTYTITPEDATDKSVTWSTNAPSLASVDQDGTVHALGYGGAVITATTTDGNITAACMVTIPNK